MTNEPSGAILERNVGLLVRRWADPLSPDQVDGACQDFLRRVAAVEPQIPPKSSAGGRLGLAAALLLGAITFWAIFAWRGDRVAPPGAGVPAGPAQSDDDAIQALIAKLRSSSFEEQGRAADVLEGLGVRATTALERATTDESVQLREWSGKILERIRKSEQAKRARIAELIGRLASDDFAEQGKAAEELRTLGKEAVQPLKDARGQSADRRWTDWIDTLLAAIENPRDGRRRTLAGGLRESETPLLAALKWLAHHQNADGSWGGENFDRLCVGDRCSGPGESDYDTGLTSISLLAFLGAGYSQLSKDEYPDPVMAGRKLHFGEVVKKGLQWLLACQDPEGCVGRRGSMKYMYNHATAALCLSETYGMTGSQSFKGPAQKAIDFLVASQNPGRGWRYSSRGGDNDTSVTGWAVFALKSAELSDLRFPKSCYTGALKWLDEISAPENSFQAGYNARGTGKVFVPGKNERFDSHPTMSAISIVSRIFMGQKKTEPAMGGVQLLMKDLPQWKADKIDFYYWHFGSLALFQYDGPDGGLWKPWNEAMKNALIPHQKRAKDGCRNGSWDPEDERWGAEGGRIYTTAIAALTLETYYRYSLVWGDKK